MAHAINGPANSYDETRLNGQMKQLEEMIAEERILKPDPEQDEASTSYPLSLRRLGGLGRSCSGPKRKF
jgi:hypothetical protein